MNMAENDGEELASIFNDAFTNDRDRGDTSASTTVEKEQPADAAVAEQPVAEAPQAEPESKEVIQGRDPRTGKFVPVSELVEERRKLKGERDTEARLRKEAEDRASEYQAKVEAYERALAATQQRQQQPRQEAEPAPNPDEDPVGYLQHQIASMQHRMVADRVLASEERAVEAFGEAPVREAEQMAIRGGLINRILAQRDPYKSLMQWHRNVKQQQEVGGDLGAYRERIEKEAREKVLAEIRAQGMPSVQTVSAAPQKFPASLASATAAGGDSSKETPESMFNDVFARR